MKVIDASALLEILKQTEIGFELAESLDGWDLHAPHLIDLEVAQALRRLTLHGEITQVQAQTALRAFVEMPIVRYEHLPLLQDVWALRNNLSAYDASYLALARFLGAELVTVDEGLRKIAARGRTH